MDEQREEDLNPSNEDIEEKVKRMLDPRFPDDPATSAPEPSIAEKKITIQAVSSPVSATPDLPPSAPELPGTSGKKPAKEKSKKIIVPIEHDDEQKPEGEKESETTEGASEIKQITIIEHNESPEDVAEELDEAIAGLSHEKPNDTEDETEDIEPIEAPTAEDPAETEEIEPIEPAEAAKPIEDSLVIEDPATDKAVEEIVAKEGDELLEIEDAVRDTDVPLKSVKKPKRSLRQLLKAAWHKPAVRWATIIVLVLGIAGAGIMPSSRYFLLNTAGVRATSSLLVLDDSTQQPLKNVQVSLGGVGAFTDNEGKVNLKKVKLGPSPLSIDKRAFAPVTKTIIVGWGSNPLGDFKLTPTGTQYGFTLTDFLSGKPIAKAEASKNEATALSDDKGGIKLTIDKPDDQPFVVTIKAEGYRTEQQTIDPNDKTTHALKLVPARKQVFVTKRSGKFDIYSIYIDGKDEKLVLAGNGNEQANMVLAPHPTTERIAYVSTRGNQRNTDGFLLSNLILINTEDNTTKALTASERIQIVNWSGDYLVYVQIAAGSSGDNPKRYRLMSYNYVTEVSKEIASSNYFNDVTLAGGSVYYAPSSAFQTGKPSFHKVNPDGSNAQIIFSGEVWSSIRSAYDHLTLAVQQEWYDYRVGEKAPTKLNAAPADQTSRVYMGSPDGKHAAWIDNRDGKGTLLNYDISTKNDATLHAQSGLTYPTSWLSNSVMVYRVKTDQETADYAISTDGGSPVKIRDVTNSTGISRWSY